MRISSAINVIPREVFQIFPKRRPDWLKSPSRGHQLETISKLNMTRDECYESPKELYACDGLEYKTCSSSVSHYRQGS